VKLKTFNYFVANIFRSTHAKFYQNRLRFVQDMTKFSVFWGFTVYMC